MTLQQLTWALGGLALFLFAMLMMTEGLKAFGGSGLKRLLGRWTSTPLRGVFAGIAVTALVQSSSAVTVAAIGFVNAGLMNLRQALGVIFGTNVGTTMTAWLVSLIGFGFDIDAFALPIIAAGVALRLLQSDQRYQGLGDALIGFGLFFMGLDLLQQAFGGMAAAYGADALAGGVGVHWAAALALGFVVTLLTQSSSAAVAIILTAATGGLIDLPTAAAAIIGANVGTTATAALAALKATAAARRLALGHIGFNVITGVVALLLLPLMLWLIDWLASALHLQDNPAVFLALFHTVFNVMGVLLLLPFTQRLADWLEGFFRSHDDQLARPQHLDHTLASSPELALGAVRAELPRLRAAIGSVATAALDNQRQASSQAEAARQLAAAITEYIASLRAARMPRQVSDDLTLCLRATRYFDEAGRMVASAQRLAAAAAAANPPEALPPILAAARTCLSAPCSSNAAELAEFERMYQHGKASLLSAVVAQQIEAERADGLLDDLSHLRRLLQQWVKADTMLACSDSGRPAPEGA
ncbi:MAG: Na/Pi cotransporter [Comamonadaceae bacterium]|nr:Na/Pi cotransporter [Comamonadaceae bacterium]